MDRQETRYLVGIGGWEHGVFDECLYPGPEMSSSAKLAYLAGYLDAVEVRQTFWDEDLGPAEAREWAAAVACNRSFLFSVKLHASFTHGKTPRPQVTRNVRGILAELARQNRLAALLAQFPYAFTNTSANRYYLTTLGETFRGFPVHVEFRHESWNQPSTLDMLEENGLRPVSADLPRIRQYMPFTTAVIGDSAYIRLHGRNERGWLLNAYDARYDYLYNSREIQEIRRRCEALSRKCRQVIMICNNTTGGKAIAGALQLRASLQESKRVSVPAAALRVFPHLADVARHETSSLFSGEPLREAM